MDTYFSTNLNCVKCGRCVTACNERGEQFLGGVRDNCPHPRYDYVPCHHCHPHKCMEVCHYNAIEIERW